MILLVSHRGDEHLAPVRAALRRRRLRVEVLDTGRFPRRGRIAFDLGGDRPERLALRDGPLAFLAGEVRAVWWRRPRACEPDPAIPLSSHREFALRETEAALAGLWPSLRARWVNDPAREARAVQKVWQLQVARQAGLPVPRTCVTSDPGRARAFLRELLPGRAIFKSLETTFETWRETRLLGPEERRLLPLLRHAPVIVQEHVEGVDVRVTCVGDRLFAAEIDARDTGHATDYRIVLARSRIRPVRLPGAVAEGLRRLHRRLGILYGAVDLRRSEAGEWLFLESNPSGQFLFVEERTGQPITEALCDLLTGSQA